LPLSALGVGVHTLVLSYAGDSTHAASTSDPFTQTISKADSSVTLTSTANPAVHGQSGTITATVATVSPGTGVPTGTVTVTIDGVTGGTAALSSGKASLKLSVLGVGSHTIVVTYAGDAGRNGSTSAPFTQTIT
jgi:hypothetical protein